MKEKKKVKPLTSTVFKTLEKAKIYTRIINFKVQFTLGNQLHIRRGEIEEFIVFTPD